MVNVSEECSGINNIILGRRDSDSDVSSDNEESDNVCVNEEKRRLVAFIPAKKERKNIKNILNNKIYTK